MGIETRHRGIVVEALDKQSLMVEVRKAHRTIKALHTTTFTPLGNGIYQRAEHCIIIYKVKPSEAALLNTPRLVSAMVYDAHDATHNFIVAISHIYHEVAHLESRVSLWVKGIYLIEKYRWTVVVVTLVKVYSKLHKFA
jgi:hypothetical protein